MKQSYGLRRGAALRSSFSRIASNSHSLMDCSRSSACILAAFQRSRPSCRGRSTTMRGRVSFFAALMSSTMPALTPLVNIDNMTDMLSKHK